MDNIRPQELQKSSISLEQEKIKSDMELLVNTEGFTFLTERQQKLIRQSLYIQARAERGTDEASAAAITKDYWRKDVTRIKHDFQLDDQHKERRQYKNSQNHIVKWACYDAVANLEKEKGLTETPDNLPDDFFGGEYNQVKSFEELTQNVITFGVPSILHVYVPPYSVPHGVDEEEISWPYRVGSRHACLILGQRKDGEIIVWDKEMNTYPYRVTTLKAVYDYYYDGNDKIEWGLRKLKSSKT